MQMIKKIASSCFRRHGFCSAASMNVVEKPVRICLQMPTSCFIGDEWISYPPTAFYMIKLDKPSSSNKVPVFYDNQSATIKRLPNLPLSALCGSCDLAVVNSKLYNIASNQERFAVMDLIKEDHEEWELVSIRNKKDKKLCISDPVVGEDGYMYVRTGPDMRIRRIRHDADGRIFIQPVCSSSKQALWDGGLIRLTNNRIYVRKYKDIYCYNLESKEIIKHRSFANLRDFCFDYHPLLLDDEGRYLCVCKNAEKRMNNKGKFDYKLTSGLYIYDTKLKKGVSRKVQGLPNDGLILPHSNFMHVAQKELCGRYNEVFMLRIGTHEGSPVLALVWSTSAEGPDNNWLHFCNFILHVEEEEGGSHPVFKAEILSYGRNELDSEVGGISACTAGVISRMNDEGANNRVSRLANDSVPWKEVKIVDDPPEPEFS